MLERVPCLDLLCDKMPRSLAEYVAAHLAAYVAAHLAAYVAA